MVPDSYTRQSIITCFATIISLHWRMVFIWGHQNFTLLIDNTLSRDEKKRNLTQIQRSIQCFVSAGKGFWNLWCSQWAFRMSQNWPFVFHFKIYKPENYLNYVMLKSIYWWENRFFSCLISRLLYSYPSLIWKSPVIFGLLQHSQNYFHSSSCYKKYNTAKLWFGENDSFLLLLIYYSSRKQAKTINNIRVHGSRWSYEITVRQKWKQNVLQHVKC